MRSLDFALAFGATSGSYAPTLGFGGEGKESNLANPATARLLDKRFSGLANSLGTSWEHVHEVDPLALRMGTTFEGRLRLSLPIGMQLSTIEARVADHDEGVVRARRLPGEDEARHSRRPPDAPSLNRLGAKERRRLGDMSFICTR